MDSTPTLQEPQSIINGIFPCKSLKTCSAFVGLGREDKFALGAAKGIPNAFINANAIG